LAKQKSELMRRINSVALKAFPSTIGIKYNSETKEVSMRQKDELYTKEEETSYGFKQSEVNFNTKYATTKPAVFQKLIEVYTKREEKGVQGNYAQASKEFSAKKAAEKEKRIKRNKDLYNETFDIESELAKNPNAMYILNELSEVSEEKFCLSLGMPEEMLKSASKDELKKYEKYKKTISKKKETLGKIESSLAGLAETRNTIFNIKLAIEELNKTSKIPIAEKQKMLKINDKRLKEEEKKEEKIVKKIGKLKQKARMGIYDKKRYQAFSRMAKMQDDFELSSKEAANEKSYLQEDIRGLTSRLSIGNLSQEELADLGEELEIKRRKLAEMGENSLTTEQREAYKAKIMEFWQRVMDMELSKGKRDSIKALPPASEPQKDSSFREGIHVSKDELAPVEPKTSSPEQQTKTTEQSQEQGF